MIRSDKRQTKLTWEKVDRIRHLYKTTTLSHRKIGVMFGVSGRSIGFIVNEVHWRPETDPRRKGEKWT